MVPASFHEFFSGCANVAGALVGLLFVAISVSPSKPADATGAIGFQVGAGIAFSSLVNALVVTLFALLPKTNLGIVTLVAGISGLSTITGLVVLQLREPPPRRLRDFALVTVLTSVYVVQLVNAVRLLHDPGATGAVDDEAVLVVVCFLIGIVRAWELLGIRQTGIVHTALRIRLSSSTPSTPIEPDEHPPA